MYFLSETLNLSEWVHLFMLSYGVDRRLMAFFGAYEITGALVVFYVCIVIVRVVDINILYIMLSLHFSYYDYHPIYSSNFYVRLTRMNLVSPESRSLTIIGSCYFH